ncbi:asparagine synthetase B family protein [Sphingomonas phyllosphaerae]|uniref:asparagine synthetase B family protein n=1 Tax=Sphingomonas phyllosphaerae TaxID=257003 RepID=UPI0003F67DE1|nr:asparagine synthase-related protein [Sphingomonas phyllosphaerae]
MGAIAGLFHPSTPKPVDPARVRAMAAAMAHRGPDGAGEWTAPGVGFAHRRLAVIGGAAATQPVATADLRYAAMLDGTILNHAALRDELRALGHRFAGEGDAEVVLHGFAAWGPSLLERLEGAFAIAVHDAATQTLFLARDRLGAKPLHLAMLPDGALIFASELKGLLAHPLLRRVPDAAAVGGYLALGYVPDDACVIAGIEKLAAGHFLLVERARPLRGARRWWGLPDAGEAPAEALLPELRAAVARGAGAARPVALLLGGLGDAAVVALAAEASAKAVPTVGVGDDGGVAGRFATAHRHAALGDLPALLDDLVEAFDEPCGDPAALAAIVAARGSGPVVMSGAGASLLLEGGRWRRFARRERWRRWRWTLPGLGAAEADYALAIGAAEASELWNATGGRAVMQRFAAVWGGGDPLDAALRTDLATRLPGQVLTIADRAGMAAGAEWRTPFADPRLVTFVLSLPAGVQRARTSPLVGAMARYLPATPVAAPLLPVSQWLRGPLSAEVARLERSRLLAELGWFDTERIAAEIERHRGGEDAQATLLWRLLVLERSLSRLFGWPASA